MSIALDHVTPLSYLLTLDPVGWYLNTNHSVMIVKRSVLPEGFHAKLNLIYMFGMPKHCK